MPADWVPAPDPDATAHRLVDLHQRRQLAAAQERLAQALFDDTVPATEIATLLEEEALRVQAALRNSTAGRLPWTSALLPQILADAEARRLQREVTGSAVLGVSTGLVQLDGLLSGLNEGLHLLAGPPGMGKTTPALQMAAAATRDVPVIISQARRATSTPLRCRWVPDRCGCAKGPSMRWRCWRPAGVLTVGAGPAAAAVGGEVLAMPQNLREPWAERVAIMVMDGGLRCEEAERLAWAGLQAPGAAR